MLTADLAKPDIEEDHEASTSAQHDDDGASSLWASFDEIAGGESTSNVAAGRKNELEMHRAESTIHRRHDPLAWWKMNDMRFPKLGKLARKYLSAPPTNVPSERLFSIAGDVYDSKRSCLKSEKAEQLIFLKANLEFIDFDY